MTASNAITDYLGEGLFADRPATPNVPAGGTAIYYATDTGNSYIWDGTGAAWVQLNGGGGGGGAQAAIAHSAVFSHATDVSSGLNVGVAPAADSLLIAIVQLSASLFTSPAAASGWTLYGGGRAEISLASGLFHTDSYAYTAILYKVAGMGESTTQVPVSNAVGGSIAYWEVTDGVLGIPVIGVDNNATSGATVTVTYPVTRADQLTVGAFLSSASGGPASDSGLSNIHNATATNASVRSFANTASGTGSDAPSATYTGTNYIVAVALPVG